MNLHEEPHNKAVYFVSDVHLGLPTPHQTPQVRERLFVEWLQEIAPHCSQLFLLGDIFDFWYEYTHVVPRGHVRTLGMLGSLHDKGIPVHFFRGNHDMWVGHYLQEEVGLIIHDDPENISLFNTPFHLGHGDGLGPGGKGYKLMKRCLRHKLLHALFGILPPRFTFGIALGWSYRSRKHEGVGYHFQGSREPLAVHVREVAHQGGPRIAVMGHMHHATLHLEQDATGTPSNVLMLLGEWITGASYARFDGNTLSLFTYHGAAAQPPQRIASVNVHTLCTE